MQLPEKDENFHAFYTKSQVSASSSLNPYMYVTQVLKYSAEVVNFDITIHKLGKLGK